MEWPLFVSCIISFELDDYRVDQGSGQTKILAGEIIATD